MAFIGATINTVKGFADLYLNKRKLNELREIDKAELHELVPWNKRDEVSLKLLQAEHIHLLCEGASRGKLSKIERDIADQMDNNIESKRQELAAKKATQLDIAHTVLSIQKLATETADEIDAIQKKVDRSEQSAKQALVFVRSKTDELNTHIQKMSTYTRDLELLMTKNAKLNRIYFSFCFLAIVLMLYLVLSK